MTNVQVVGQGSGNIIEVPRKLREVMDMIMYTVRDRTVRKIYCPVYKKHIGSLLVNKKRNYEESQEHRG